MQKTNVPIYKTKRDGLSQSFDLNDPSGRKKYFEAKVGDDVKKIQDYLEKGPFVAFLMGKKNSGKGTYSKLFMEIVGSEHVSHLSIGDIVRDAHIAIEDLAEKQKLLDFLSKEYRGFHEPEEVEDAILSRGTTTLLASELILALIKWELSKRPHQALFIDGFPRALDQIQYSLFLKQILGYQHHPDMFVFLNVPESIIDERIKYRVVCPICKTPRNTRLLATSEAGYDESTKEFYLMCDNPDCNKTRMVAKEGDELGIEPIRARLEMDDQISKQLGTLKGVPKIFLSNSVPVEVASEYVDDYEITPAYSYKHDPATGKVTIIEKPWTIKDDNGVESYSLLPPAVVCGLIDQMARALKLKD